MRNESGYCGIGDSAGDGVIGIRLTPEAAHGQLVIGLYRTRRRAGSLLAELLDATREADFDREQIRDLADGIRFESWLGGELAGAIGMTGPGSSL